MSYRRLIRIPVLVGACLCAVAFTGLSWAATGSGSASGPVHRQGKLCAKYDVDDTPYCFSYGPRGKRGPQGHVGARGPEGLLGPVGIKGIVGPVGPRGAQGIQGVTGPIGPTGPDGAFVAPSGSNPGGSDPGGNTIEVLGTKIGPTPFPQGPSKGTVLTPSVAQCPAGGNNTEAYDGGAIITTANANGQPTTDDVVGLANSFAGVDNGPTEVDPPPGDTTPGSVSTEPANAYEAQAVVTEMHSGDNLTVQAYVICGP